MKGELYLASTVRSYSRHLKKIQQQKSAHSPVSWGSEELEKLPHRGYTTASLKKKADKQSIYDGTAKNTANSFEFLGLVVAYNNEEKRVYFQTKNPLQEGVEIEILTPQKNIIVLVENLKMLKEIVFFIAIPIE